MDILLVVFLQLFGSLDGYYFLGFIEAFHLEILPKLYLILAFALSLGNLCKSFAEFRVEIFKVFLFLSHGHEEKVWQLRVILFEFLSEFERHRIDVVSDIKVIISCSCCWLFFWGA